MQQFLPPPSAPLAEQFRAVAGALFGLALAAVLSCLSLGPDAVWLIAPMGASAVILFAMPASPLAQPWPVVGGNLVSALVGVACAAWVSNPQVAAPLAGALAIMAMFSLRCLHPPGGAVALTAVLGGPAIHKLGVSFALAPVGLNALLMVMAALLYNNLTGRRYPHISMPVQANLHATSDPAPTARLGFRPEDLDAVLQRYGQVLDISRDDLETILLQTEMEAYRRRFGTVSCDKVMSRDVVAVEYGTPLMDAWRLMRRHDLHALPVLSPERRVIGIVTQGDFIRHSAIDDYAGMGEKLRAFLRTARRTHSDKPEVVGQIMSRQVEVAHTDTPIVELVPMMANSGLHHVPVVDREQRFAGMVTQSDVLAALYETRVVG
jgi:CBS domain-containing membrane protein